MCNDGRMCKMQEQSSALCNHLTEAVCAFMGTTSFSKAGVPVDSAKKDKKLSHDDMQVIMAGFACAYAGASVDAGCPPQIAVSLVLQMLAQAYGGQADIKIHAIDGASMRDIMTGMVGNKPRPQEIN